MDFELLDSDNSQMKWCRRKKINSMGRKLVGESNLSLHSYLTSANPSTSLSTSSKLDTCHELLRKKISFLTPHTIEKFIGIVPSFSRCYVGPKCKILMISCGAYFDRRLTLSLPNNLRQSATGPFTPDVCFSYPEPPGLKWENLLDCDLRSFVLISHSGLYNGRK